MKPFSPTEKIIVYDRYEILQNHKMYFERLGGLNHSIVKGHICRTKTELAQNVSTVIGQQGRLN